MRMLLIAHGMTFLLPKSWFLRGEGDKPKNFSGSLSLAMFAPPPLSICFPCVWLSHLATKYYWPFHGISNSSHQILSKLLVHKAIQSMHRVHKEKPHHSMRESNCISISENISSLIPRTSVWKGEARRRKERREGNQGRPVHVRHDA